MDDCDMTAAALNRAMLDNLLTWAKKYNASLCIGQQYADRAAMEHAHMVRTQKQLTAQLNEWLDD